MLLLTFGYSQVLTLGICPSISAAILSFTFSPFYWLLTLILNLLAYPCSTQDKEDMSGGHRDILNKQETAGCSHGIKGKNPSRRQKPEHGSCSFSSLWEKTVWSCKPSRVQSHRSWCTAFNKFYSFANSLSHLFVSCLWTLSNVTSCYNYFLRILSLFSYYDVITNSTAPSWELAHCGCLVFLFLLSVSFEGRNQKKRGVAISINSAIFYKVVIQICSVKQILEYLCKARIWVYRDLLEISIVLALEIPIVWCAK